MYDKNPPTFLPPGIGAPAVGKSTKTFLTADFPSLCSGMNFNQIVKLIWISVLIKLASNNAKY